MSWFGLNRIILFFLILYTPQAFSKSVLFPHITTETYTKVGNIFKNNNEKYGYALGVSLGNYINQLFEKQKKVGINLDKHSLLIGVQDAISRNLKVSDENIISTLKELELTLKHATKIYLEKNIKNNLIQGEQYMKNISKMQGIKKTPSGLLYLLEKKGEGEPLTNNTQITVNYKGTLINGIEFDSSYKRGKPISLMLKDVILGWQEGLKYIRKGGKIKLIIPPNLAYGKQEIKGIPGNSTLIFDIELLDVVNKL